MSNHKTTFSPRKRKSQKLSDIDWTILEILQKNARITNLELSRQLGLTPPPCLRRLRLLEHEGFIRGYRADLNEAALGFIVSAFVHIGMANQTEKTLLDFERKIETWKPVRECYVLSGSNDFLLRIIAPSLDDLNNFIDNNIRTAPNVLTVKTSPIIRRTKSAIVFDLLPKKGS